MQNDTKINPSSTLLWRRPSEFVDRVSAILDVKSEKYLHPAPSYQSGAMDGEIAASDQALGWRLAEYMAETSCKAIAQQVQQAIAALPPNAPFSRRHNGDFSLAQTAYAFCRMLKLQIVVETGVAYGVTSSFILATVGQRCR